MVFTYIAGVLTGALMYKLYNSTSTDEDDGAIDRGTKRTNTTNSMATELNKTSLYNEDADSTDTSHINFLSDMVSRLWPYLGKAMADTIKDSVEPSFKETLPGPLSTLKFKKLDLGDVPLVLDNILVRDLQSIDDAGTAFGKDQNYLQFEWDITWQSDCDIQLATDKIAGMAAISFGVKTLTLSGRLQVIAKPLGNVLPCIDAIQFAFVNPPEIELDFTGLANLADMKLQFGGINLVDIKGIVRGIVDDILGSSMVLPNRVVAPLVDNVDYRDIFAPQYKGMARVRLHSGRGFEIQKATRPFGKEDIPDVYVKMRVGVEKFFKSSVCKDNCNPVWDADEECQDFLVSAYRDQILEIQAWDEDTGTLDSNDLLGKAYVTLGQIMLEADRDGMFEVELWEEGKKGKNGRSTGQYITISMDKIPFTTKDLSSMSRMALNQYRSKKDFLKMSARERKKCQKMEADRIVGLVTVLISHAENLPFAEAEEANTFVKVYGGTGPSRIEIGVTPPIPNSLNPQYMTPISLPLTVATMKDRMKSPGNESFCFEVFQQDPKNANAKPVSLGEIVVDKSQIKVGDSWSLRETRAFGLHPRTKLAFSISYAGVSQQSVRQKKIFNNMRNSVSSSLSGFISLGENNSDPSSRETNDDGMELVVEENKMRVHIVRGYGFRMEEKKRFRKADVPDVYCVIKFGSSPDPWRTTTIKDCESPEWEDEFRDYKIESLNEVISIDVWDENRKSDDTYYGNARTSLGKIMLNNGTLDIEVKQDSGGNKRTPKKNSMAENIMFITVQCQKL